MIRASSLSVAVIALAGCGGSSTSKPNPSAAFLARADAICVHEHERDRVLIHKSREAPTLGDLAATRARTARELSALTPPPALKPLYHQLVSAIAQEAALQLRADEAFRKHEYTAVLLANYRKLRGNAVSRPARLIDLTDCVY